MTRPARSEHWEIEQVEEDRWEIRQGRKRKTTVGSEREAIAYVRTRRQDGQKVVVIEPDGYRLDISRRFTKGGLR